MTSLPSNLMSETGILLDAGLEDKPQVLESLAELLEDNDISKEEILQKLEDREELGSTGLGYGVALPHARSKNISIAKAAFIRLKEATEFEAPDDEEVDLIFALLVPEGANEEYLQLLATLAKLLNNPEIRDALRSIDSPEDIILSLTTDMQLSESA